MDSVKVFIEKFESLQKRRVAMETEQAILLKERETLINDLQVIHAQLSPENLDANILALETKLQAEIEQLSIPKEYQDELSRIESSVQ